MKVKVTVMIELTQLYQRMLSLGIATDHISKVYFQNVFFFPTVPWYCHPPPPILVVPQLKTWQ